MCCANNTEKSAKKVTFEGVDLQTGDGYKKNRSTMKKITSSFKNQKRRKPDIFD